VKVPNFTGARNAARAATGDAIALARLLGLDDALTARAERELRSTRCIEEERAWIR
jgi:hypothetical protein